MPTVEAGRSRQALIPKEIWGELHLEPGDYFEVKVAKTGIIFIPKKLVDRDPWHWSEEDQRHITESLKDIETGHVEEFSTVDDLVKDLES